RAGPRPRAPRALERSLDLSRTWQLVIFIPISAAALGVAYAAAGRADEALPLVAEAVEDLLVRRPFHARPAHILRCAGRTYFPTGRIDEPARHVREALALARRLGARAS